MLTAQGRAEVSPGLETIVGERLVKLKADAERVVASFLITINGLPEKVSVALNAKIFSGAFEGIRPFQVEYVACDAENPCLVLYFTCQTQSKAVFLVESSELLQILLKLNNDQLLEKDIIQTIADYIQTKFIRTLSQGAIQGAMSAVLKPA